MSDAPHYLTLVVAHYRRPHNHRALASPTHVHEGVNQLCGDRVRMEVEVREGAVVGDHPVEDAECDRAAHLGREGAVVDAAFAASACAIATASASLLTERVRGVPVDEVLQLNASSAITALGDGVPAARHGCASLALRVLQQALASSP